MPTVADTSVVMNPAVIGRLAILQDQFGTILVPRAVMEELRLDDTLPGNQEIRQAVQDGWLQTREAQQKALVTSLRSELHRGEAEAIALAVELNTDWLLLDERDARRVAKSHGLRVTGVLGILRKAWQEKRIPSLRAAVADLQTKAGFRIHQSLLDEILKDSE